MAGLASVAKSRNTLSVSWVRETIEGGLLNARTLASSVKGQNRLSLARTIVSSVISVYWSKLQTKSGHHWSLCRPPSKIEIAPLPDNARELAERIGEAASMLDVMDASYMIGALYTGMMPDGFRSELGAYYTPPALCERLLNMVTDAGVDWRSARVLDPACGGGAFLSPVAKRMVDNLRDGDAATTLESIQRRLHGFELDPFAAWMSQVFLDATLEDLYTEAGKRLKPVVGVRNSLEQKPGHVSFDLVLGNPPYGRVTLSPELREKFRRSLFGHANLYGVFTDLALRFTRLGGVIAYVTPTSFLAGEYFKALRGLLGQEAPPISIDFINERKGVFAGVLQETLLVVCRRGGDIRGGKVHFSLPGPDGSIVTEAAGSFSLPKNSGQPWLIPRTRSQSSLLRTAGSMRHRLADYGYKVSTGPLVWNRHKPSLRDRPAKGRFPLIWAESVRSDGIFEFRAKKHNHVPFFEPQQNEEWVLTDFPCVLLQRTTAKEQSRRLIAAELPASFIKQHGKVVVENHLNMIRPIDGGHEISPAALAALLNTEVIDQLFRCINGSVAVSAYELEALPLPAPVEIAEIEHLVICNANPSTIERAVTSLYT